MTEKLNLLTCKARQMKKTAAAASAAAATVAAALKFQLKEILTNMKTEVN